MHLLGTQLRLGTMGRLCCQHAGCLFLYIKPQHVSALEMIEAASGIIFTICWMINEEETSAEIRVGEGVEGFVSELWTMLPNVADSSITSPSGGTDRPRYYP